MATSVTGDSQMAGTSIFGQRVFSRRVSGKLTQMAKFTKEELDTTLTVRSKVDYGWMEFTKSDRLIFIRK